MRELDALLRRKVLAEQRANARAGQVCAVIANVYRDPKRSHAYTAGDFFDLGESTPEPGLPPNAEMLDHVLAWAGRAGVEVVVREQDA